MRGAAHGVRLVVVGLAFAMIAALCFALVPTASAEEAPRGASSAGEVVQKAYQRTDRVVAGGERFRIYDPSVGEAGEWYINDHTILRGPDGKWHLFGITHAEPADPLDETFFAHATADSLTQKQWVKQAPVIPADVASGETHVWAPFVMEHDGTFYMFYAGGTSDHEAYRMQLATSKDLYHWDRNPDQPLFTDGFDGRDPMVLRVGKQWVMYYTANSTPAGGNHIVAYRTSPDLRTWGERKVAFTSPKTGTFGGPTESPFVVQKGKHYYLFVCCDRSYTDTRVYRSKNPLHFDPEDLVGSVDEHASEVVRDRKRWYVSGAGWGKGGVYLRPLDFRAKQVTAGRIISTPDYRLDVQTRPKATIRSMQVRRPDRSWDPVLDDDYRGTAPYLAVGTFGNTDTTGPARSVESSRHGRSLTLRGVQLGDEPVTVDWRLDFDHSWFDSSMRWKVSAAPTAPLWEVAWTFDSALDMIGDEVVPDRPSGDVAGFSRFTGSSSDDAAVAAAYRTGSAWREDNRFVETAGTSVVWQPLWRPGGEALAPGAYDGGTWRIGAAADGDATALGEALHRSLNR